MNWQSIEEPGWRSIVEPPARVTPHGVVVLTGVLVTEADAYRRARCAGTRGTSIAALVGALTAVLSWAGSAVLHLAPVIVLMGYLVIQQRPEQGFLSVGLGIRETAQVVAPVPSKEPEQAPEAKPPKQEPIPAPPVESKSEPEPVPAAAPLAPEPPKPAEAPEKPVVIGTGGGAPAPQGKPADAATIVQDPGAAVRQTRAAELERLKGGKKTDIVVVTGCYDQTEEVLSHLKVPHTVIEPAQLADYDLSACGALIIDCNNTYAQGAGADSTVIADVRKEVEKLQARVEELQALIAAGEKKKDSRVKRWRDELKQKSSDLQFKRNLLANLVDVGAVAKKLRTFVTNGGYLFTSDWSLTLVEKAFPGMVRVGGYVGPRTVKIQPKKGAEKSSLLKEVFTTPAKGSTTTARTLRWEIDGSSYSIRTDSAQVETLVESPDIAAFRAVVVTFRWDGEKSVDPRTAPAGGRVLHMLSHFADQGDKFGDYALQNMLVNFLLERFTRR